MCDECKRSIDSGVCQKFWSILWPHEQVCSRTIHYQVYQYEPHAHISEQFVSKLWIVLQLIPFILLYFGGHQGMASRLWTIARLFYSQVRNIFPRISLHDLPYHRTMKISFRHQVSAWLLFLAFFIAPAEIMDSNMVLWLSCLFDILFECNPNTHGRGMMLVLPDQRLSWESSMMD